MNSSEPLQIPLVSISSPRLTISNGGIKLLGREMLETSSDAPAVDLGERGGGQGYVQHSGPSGATHSPVVLRGQLSQASKVLVGSVCGPTPRPESRARGI